MPDDAPGATTPSRHRCHPTSLRSRPPAFEPHGGGELVLTGGATLESLLQVVWRSWW